MPIGIYTRPSAEDRFWSKVDRGARPDGCWLWRGATLRGYGQFWSPEKGNNVRAHRWAYEQAMGAIPDGLALDHLCRTRACVNPAHLEPVTTAENIRRGETGKRHRDKTACHRGHAFDDKNTYRTNGKRYCRRCKADRQRARQRRLRSEGSGNTPATVTRERTSR